MLHHNYEELYHQLRLSLTAFSNNGLEQASWLSQSLTCFHQYSVELKNTMSIYPFQSLEDEISFFKYFKPKFYAEKMFCISLYNTEMNKPVSTPKVLRLFIRNEIKHVQHFLLQNALYHYYRSGATQMDSVYFLRGAKLSSTLVPEVLEADPEFSTGVDEVFAKFIACERFIDYLVNMFAKSHRPSPLPPDEIINPIKKVSSATMINLSVDQIGMGARAALDASLISGKSFQSICEDLAPRLATSKTDKVSPASLRSNAYLGEDGDKLTLIRHLEKMIRLIKEY